MTTSPETHSLNRPEDVLAYIPHALGFQPRNSLVMLILEHNALSATLRVDLPLLGPGTDDTRIAARHYLGILRKVQEATDVFLAVYPPECADPQPGPLPYNGLVAELGARLKGAGIQLRDAWLVGPDSWYSYHCQEPGCCPEAGHPVPELALTETHLRLVVAGSAPTDEPWDGSGAPAWVNRGQIRDHLELMLSHLAGPQRQEPLLRRWGDLLAQDPAMAERRMRSDAVFCASLLAALHEKPVRDMLPYLAGHGLRPAVCALAETSADATPGAAAALFSGFLLGHSPLAPDWRRLDRFWYLLRDLLGVASGADEAALLCLLAWIEWARGRGSSALALLGGCLVKEPGYRLAVLLRQLLEQGEMPDWVADKSRAWHPEATGAASA